MNTPNRHMRYRRSVYRKRRIKIIAITVSCAVVVLALLFVIIGNVLGSRTDGEDSEQSGVDTEQGFVDGHSPVREVRACHVPLNEDGSSLSGRLSSAVRGGYSDVCFELDTADGKLLYISEIAQSLGKQTSGATDMRTISSIVSLLDSNRVYSIGITHISDFSSDDDLVRSAAAGFYAAQIAEALRAGVDDVLIYVGDIPTERYGELIGLADQIHRLSPEGNLGLSLPVSVLSGADNSALVDKLWNAFDYLAADLSVQDNTESDTADQIGNELGGMLYYLLRYNMRVLVPNTDDAALTQRIADAVWASGAKSIQIMP